MNTKETASQNNDQDEISKIKNHFLKFSLYRTILFVGIAMILTIFSVFGGRIVAHYLPERNIFRNRANNLSVHFIDVGNGYATAVRFPDNTVALIDGGSQFFGRRVEQYLRRRVIFSGNRIDYLILTAPRPSHFGGMLRILDNFNVQNVYLPLQSPDTVPNHPNDFAFDYYDFADFAKEHSARIGHLQSGITILSGIIGNKNFNLMVHAIVPENHEFAGINLNNVSSVITIEFGNQVFVLAGNSISAGETAFINSPSSTHIFGDFFDENRGNHGKVVHLGVGSNGCNQNSSMVPFLEYVNPHNAIISVGVSNYCQAYSYVRARLLNFVDRNNIFLTRELSHIAIRTDGQSYRMFLGFDNPPNLWWLYAILIIIAFFLCFFNYTFKYQKKIKVSDSNNPNTIDITPSKKI
ncbi:MAG: hypothetical protein FWE01_03345 [Firmicutes bacterium]|nr:hypothetical protein [Bacillota bacterium]